MSIYFAKSAASAHMSLCDRQLPGATEELRRKGLEYARAALAVAGSDANVRVTVGTINTNVRRSEPRKRIGQETNKPRKLCSTRGVCVSWPERMQAARHQ